MKVLQVAGPVAPGGQTGQFGPAQVAGPMVPMQVTGAGAYLPTQNGFGDIMTTMMPMIMMIVMLAMIMPMMKGISAS